MLFRDTAFEPCIAGIRGTSNKADDSDPTGKGERWDLH